MNTHNNNDKLSRLLSLKRYEKASEKDITACVYEFHRRLRGSSAPSRLSVLWESFLNLWPNFQVPRYAYAVAAAVFLAGGTFIMTFSSTNSSITHFEIHRNPDLSIAVRMPPVEIGRDVLPAAFQPTTDTAENEEFDKQAFTPRPLRLDQD